MENTNLDSFPKKRVEHLVFRDELTNAFNRRYLFQYLPQEIAKRKGTGSNIWLFMIDIDDFKLLNDNYGHLTGDEILKKVTEVLNKCVRQEDAVVRYAGDEFTVILYGGELSEAMSIAKNINKSVSQNQFKVESGKTITKVNLSIGLANFPDDATEALKLIDLADRALYASKQKGKNRISLVSDISVDLLREKEIQERFPCPSLIERQQYLGILKQAFSSIKKEKAFKMVIIKGEAGVGKSRLLDEFLHFLSSAESFCFYSACSEKRVSQSYFYFINNLEKFFQQVKDLRKEELANGLTSNQQSLLAGFIPSLKDFFQVELTENQDNPEQEDVGTQIKDGLLKLIINLSNKKSLCILCDDYHLIDKQSLELVLSLGEQNCHIMFCAAYPEDDIGSFESYPIAEKLSSINDLCSETINLDNLSEKGTSEMISVIIENMESSRELDALIYKISRGNPLFIEELLKFLIQKGFIYFQKGKWGKIDINESDIPHSLEEVIQERIKDLDSAAKEIITKAAVIGQDFSIDLLHKMGKENEGYVLDILESAKKAGIIKQKVSPYGEEMSFVSDEIRKALYDLMEQDKLKNLHKQVGEIQEGIYSGNLDQIAGELYFHFKKAEDYHRATEYAKRIKESDRMLFGRAIEYAKEILEGIDEKKTEALSKRSLELIPDIVRLLYIVNINFALYPKSSQMLQSPIDQIYNKLTEVFARDEMVVFTEIKNTLVVNGKRFGSAALKKSFQDSFISLMKTHNIDSLTFKKGLSKKELDAFIECLNTASESSSLSQELKSKEINNIVINEIGYEMSQKISKTQEREKLEDVMLVDYLLGKISSDDKSNFLDKLEQRPWEVAEAITKMSDVVTKESKDNLGRKETKADVVIKSVQKLANQIMQKDPKEWNKHKKNLAKTILNLEPQLRRDVLFAEGKTGIDKHREILKELVPEFPDDVVIELLTDEFTKTKASTTKLKSLINRFLINVDQKKRLSVPLKERFTRLGLSKEDIAWVFSEKSWKDLSLDEKIIQFSKMTAKDSLDLEIEIDIASLVMETFKQKREDLLKIIFNKWKEFLGENSPEIKTKVNAVFKGLLELAFNSKEDMFVNLIGYLFDVFREDKDSDIYLQLINYLTKPTISLIEKKKYLAANKIIQILEKESSVSGLPEKQKRVIKEAQEKIMDKARLKEIISELIKKVDDGAYYDDIVQFIIALSSPGLVKLLVEEAMIEEKLLRSLGYFAAFLRRRTIGMILGKLVKTNAREMINKELLEKISDSRPFVVKNTIELFVFINDPSLVNSIQRLIQHEDSNIRSRVILALARIGGKDSCQLLIKALDDQDKGNRLKAIKALGKIGDKTTIEALKKYSDDGTLASEAGESIKEIETRLKQKGEG